MSVLNPKPLSHFAKTPIMRSRLNGGSQVADKPTQRGRTRGKRTPRRAAKKPAPKTKTRAQAAARRAAMTIARQKAESLAREEIGETQPAVSAEKLLEAANAASGPARNAWLGFLLLLTYLLVTLAGVTHEDLLRNSPITLPIVSVEIPLFSFFRFAPFLLLLVHLGLLVQHAMLAHKLDHFARAVAGDETSASRDHPDRRLIHFYVFSQLMAGPKQPLLARFLMRTMVYVTFSFLPVLVLLYFEIGFLPYHDVLTTHAHRLAILLDLVLLLGVWPLYAMPYLLPKGPKLRLGPESWTWELSYASLGVTAAVCLIVFFFSLFVATVPNGCAWPIGDQKDDCVSLDRTATEWWPVRVGEDARRREVFAPTAWLFEGEPNEVTGRPTSLFARNIVLTDANLVPDKEYEFGEVSIALRGRDLRYAFLDRADLHRADLTAADLSHASLEGTRLANANIGCAETGEIEKDEKFGLILIDESAIGPWFRPRKMECAKLRGTALREAILEGAYLGRADLREAILGLAVLHGTSFAGANLQGVELSSAELIGADLRRADLRGASLVLADLQGADLGRADLQAANLIGADLQGANLVRANLQGADLKNANISGANLSGANMLATDLGAARIWQTRPPKRSALRLADLTNANIVAVNDEERKRLEQIVHQSKVKPWGQRLREGLAPLVNAETAANWRSTDDYRIWADISKPDSAELSEFLTAMACKDDTSGYIFRNIAVRELFQTVKEYGFERRGKLKSITLAPTHAIDGKAFARAVTNKDCLGATHSDYITKSYVCSVANWPDDQIGETICAPK